MHPTPKSPQIDKSEKNLYIASFIDLQIKHI